MLQKIHNLQPWLVVMNLQDHANLSQIVVTLVHNQRKSLVAMLLTCQEGQAMGRCVIELIAEEHQAPHQQDGKDDRSPEPPILLQLLVNSLAKGGRAA